MTRQHVSDGVDGIYFRAAPALYERGLVPLPAVKDCKKPAVRRWAHLNRPGARRPSPEVIDHWRETRPTANVGSVTGQVSKLTVIDCDGAEAEDLAQEFVLRCGNTPFKIRSPTGGLHLYYRHDGERSAVRLDGLKADIRGQGGFIAMPPSWRPNKGKYTIIEGTLDDLARLPKVKPGSLPLVTDGPHRILGKQPAAQAPEATAEPARGPDGKYLGTGFRKDMLFDELLNVALVCDSIEDLQHRADGLNEQLFADRVPPHSVASTVRSVWRYKIGEHLFTKGTRRGFLDLTESTKFSNPYAAQLLTYLRCHHAPDHVFAVSPEGLGKALPYHRRTLRKARDYLVSTGKIVRTYKGGTGLGDPHLFRFGKGVTSCPQ